ncbi:hypothetical protein ACHAWF_013289 [Thalassiosira exigua]
MAATMPPPPPPPPPRRRRRRSLRRGGPGTASSRLTSPTMRTALLLALLSLVGRDWRFASAAREADADLDEASRAVADRILGKVREREKPPASWERLAGVLERSFRGGGTDGDREGEDEGEGARRSRKREDEGRRRAVRWLAHEDELSKGGKMSAGHYDRLLLERYALATIYFAAGGDLWTTCSRNQESQCENDEARWLSPASHIGWSGINGKDDRVTWLDLSGRGLVSDSYLPPELAIVGPRLELLWTSENPDLSGTLPDCLGEFNALVTLGAYKTSMSGTIPESIYQLPKLSAIRLYKSNFEGTISSKIGKAGELKWFWIHDNHFSGTIPESMGKLLKLEGATLHGNDFAPFNRTGAGEKASKGIAKSSAEDAAKGDGEGGGEGREVGGEGGREGNEAGADAKEAVEKEGEIPAVVGDVVPPALCNLREVGLKHLWTDCAPVSLIPSIAAGEDGSEGSGWTAKEGVRACACCTRCFPRRDVEGGGVVAAAK